MAVEVLVPRLGWSMDEGTFSRWLKSHGERVNEGDPLFELEGDKATQEVESFDAGELRIPPDAPQPGEMVKVGQVLAYLCAAGEPDPWGKADAHRSPNAPAAPASPTGPSASPTVRRLARALAVDLADVVGTGRNGSVCEQDVRKISEAATSKPSLVAVASVGAERNEPIPSTKLKVSPRAAKTAARLGVDLGQVVGGGAGGRIRERDVLQFGPAPRASLAPSHVPTPSAAPCGSPAPATRRTIAQRLTAAWSVPQVTLTTLADASGLVEFRQQLRERNRGKTGRIAGYTEVMLKLAAATLARHPALMTQWTEQGLVDLSEIHICVAVDTPQGLVTPVVRNVDRLSLDELADRVADLVDRARSRRLRPEEFQGGAFTISNLGAYQVDAFTPILNPPQAAILGVGRIAPRVQAHKGDVVVRDAVSLSLTFDHRVVDGAPAAAALTTLCEFLANPLTLLID